MESDLAGLFPGAHAAAPEYLHELSLSPPHLASPQPQMPQLLVSCFSCCGFREEILGDDEKKLFQHCMLEHKMFQRWGIHAAKAFGVRGFRNR